MASKHAQDLRRRIDVASENLSRQLQGMDAHMDRTDAPGEWTTREVLSHLLFEPGFDPAAMLATFAERDYPVVEIDAGATFLDDQRRRMTLPQFRDALDAQRRRVLEYVDGLDEREFDQRKARIPLFKQFMGTDEITLDMYPGPRLDSHGTAHGATSRRSVRPSGWAAPPSAIMASTSGLVSPPLDAGALPSALQTALPFRTELSLAPLIRFWTQLSAYS